MAHLLEIGVPLIDAFLLKQMAPYLANARHRSAKAPLGMSCQWFDVGIGIIQV